ncbi:MAG: DEAD/DEAH box helicase family protein [SAR324 cluster bacterium]|nr:DEAD/DEAH box helicase family protein [SAR324 cluster bacterium]
MKNSLKEGEQIQVHFDKGTLVLTDIPETTFPLIPGIKWDDRTQSFRAPAYCYREIVLTLRNNKANYKDHARQFEPLSFSLKEKIEPRPYQVQAMKSWLDKGSYGIVALPTGSGKTILAVLLIEKIKRPTLIHVPTIDLMHQWYSVLKKYFKIEIGLLGGGYHEIKPLTVATYDSALLQVAYRGNQFGFAVYDECHHLPGEQFQYVAISSIAPFRLGLTATPERTDGRESLLYTLSGNLSFQAHIHELKGQALAPYTVITREVDMSFEEREEYEAARKCYTDFLKKEQIDFSHPRGWNTFLWKASRSLGGRQAFKAYHIQKQLSQASTAKIAEIWDLVQQHRGDRIIIFTQDNEMAYRIGRLFYMPVLTHHTKLKEREFFLDSFRNGSYTVLITSKVLNEGVDVPEANVAIVVSGSGTVREHVQRLGRILRGRPGKQAYLYELVSKSTGEYFVNKRRRQHHAYQLSQ